MPKSGNGWSVLDAAPPRLRVPYIEPDVLLALRPGDVAVILLEVARRWHNEVEPLDLPGPLDEWGWAKRNVRGSATIISNHASGTAEDLNATRHPRGVPTARWLDGSQISRCRAIRAAMYDQEYGGSVVRWGGDYSGTPDAMHWEIADNVTPAQAKRVADRIRLKWREIEDEMAAPTPEEVAQAVVKLLFATPIAEMTYVSALFKDADKKATLGELLNWSAGASQAGLGGTQEANRELDELQSKVDKLTEAVTVLTAEVMKEEPA